MPLERCRKHSAAATNCVMVEGCETCEQDCQHEWEWAVDNAPGDPEFKWSMDHFEKVEMEEAQ